MLRPCIHITRACHSSLLVDCRELSEDPLQPVSYTGEGPGGSTYCVNMTQIMRQIRLLVSWPTRPGCTASAVLPWLYHAALVSVSLICLHSRVLEDMHRLSPVSCEMTELMKSHALTCALHQSTAHTTLSHVKRIELVGSSWQQFLNAAARLHCTCHHSFLHCFVCHRINLT